jgi:hypothetical protein
MEFAETPVAVPPTLTIFVGNAAIDLDDLQIPQNIEVSTGYVPTIFWKWNRTNRPEPAPAADAAPESDERQQMIDAITAFLKRRQEDHQPNPPPR